MGEGYIIRRGGVSRVPVDDYKIYGVSVDLTNSNPETSVTYTDDAVGMAGGSADWESLPVFKDIKPCVLKNGAVRYYLDPSDYTKKADGTAAVLTGADGDVMVEFPKTGLVISTSADGNTLTIRITDNPDNPGFHYYAHTRAVEGDREKLYIGAYPGTFYPGDAARLRSVSGAMPTGGISLPDFRTRAQANGAGYDLFSFYPLTLIQALYTIRFKNLNSQAALGLGNCSSSSVLASGLLDTSGMFYGNTTAANENVKCFGIESLWGNIYQFIEGMMTDASFNILTAFDGFNSTGEGYANNGPGATAFASAYTSKVAGTSEKGFIPTGFEGSTTTYFSDINAVTSSRVARYGGGISLGNGCGVFMISLYFSPTGAAADHVGRLMYL